MEGASQVYNGSAELIVGKGSYGVFFFLFPLQPVSLYTNP